MCTPVVIDASVFGEFQKSEYQQFHSWLNKRHGMLAFTDAGVYAQELDYSSHVTGIMLEYRKSGISMKVEAKKVLQAKSMIAELEIN